MTDTTTNTRVFLRSGEHLDVKATAQEIENKLVDASRGGTGYARLKARDGDNEFYVKVESVDYFRTSPE